MKKRILFALASVAAVVALSQAPAGNRTERFKSMSEQAELKGLAEPFRGVTANNTPEQGLFAIRSTGVSTEPVRKAAATFLQHLTAEQRSKTKFGLEDPEWRKWMNQHFYIRQGVSFKEMNENQRELAISLLRASMSAR